MEAYTVHLEDMFSRQNSGMAKASQINLEVYNFGVGGFGTLQQLLVYEQQGNKRKHDLVLLGFYLSNDVRNNSNFLETLANPNTIKSTVRPFLINDESKDWKISRVDYDGARERFQKELDRRNTLLWSLSRYFVLTSKPLKIWYRYFPTSKKFPVKSPGRELKMLVKRGIYFCDEPQEYTVAWDTTRRILTRLKRRTLENQSRLVVFSVPSMKEVKSSAEERQKGLTNDPPICYDSLPAYQRLQNLLNELGIDYVNLLPKFRNSKNELFRISDKHWNEAGHKLAASTVLGYLVNEKIVGLRGIVWVIFDSTQAYHIEIMEIFRVSY